VRFSLLLYPCCASRCEQSRAPHALFDAGIGLVQPPLHDLTRDEKGDFRLYGPTAFAVAYDRAAHNFYELCEAVWDHWMRLQQACPGLDPDNVYYWIDVLAMSPADLCKPVSACGEQLQRVRWPSGTPRPG
jgi:hypothetical protein